MAEYNEQCKKCFHFQVCAQVMKNQLFIREKMLKEENPKCEHFVNAADVVEVRCKDCFFYQKDKELAEANYLDSEKYCALLKCENDKNGFCSYGKMKGGNNNG